MIRGYKSMTTTNMTTISTNMTSDLTIVIPAKNEAKLIPRLLTSLTIQDYSKMSSTRVLVADANSTDGTPEIVRSFRDRLNVSVIRGGMPSVGRNHGAAQADTPYVLFSTPTLNSPTGRWCGDAWSGRSASNCTA